MAKVYFIGAGPGDPELITLKGKRIMENSEVIIYAGSLVNPALLFYVKQGAQVYNSASLSFDEVMEITRKALGEGKNVARVHTGDPAIYGAIQEQMNYLDEQGLEYEVIPGVSSFLAAAAVLKQEYTLPEVTQTVIVTRLEGRTPVPGKESLTSLANHGSTMCIFLSVQLIDKVVEELLEGGYSADTPVVVAQRVTWHDEKVVQGTLTDIGEKVKSEKINKTALIIISPAFKNQGAMSKLYDKEFSHQYRSAK